MDFDHPSTIEGALKWAEISKECFETDPPDMDSIALQTLAGAYRSEKQNADDLEEYVAELVAQVNKKKDRCELIERQYSELADFMGHHSNERYGDMIARHEAERKK